MKTWTVVIEISDSRDDLGFMTNAEISHLVTDSLSTKIAPNSCISYQVFEVTDAPYGPQGVYLAEHKPGRAGRVRTAPVICICNPKSEYISRNCNATEHRTAKTFNNTCSKTCRPLGGVK